MKVVKAGARSRTVGYMRGGNIEFKMLMGADGKVARLCRLRGMPTFCLVGPEGDVLWSAPYPEPIGLS